MNSIPPLRAPPPVRDMLTEVIPLIDVVVVSGPPAIFILGPWLLVVLMLIGPFLLVTLAATHAASPLFASRIRVVKP